MSATTDHPIEQVGGVTAKYVDQRLGSNKFLGRNLGKVFPDHWSFMLGEIALYSFIVVLLTGTFLTLFYDPSMVEVVYNGAYVPLKGVEMSQAYASTLDISFEVRGGLLIRQMHHWSALIFVAAIAVHMFRVFFTGAFRKPREFNWLSRRRANRSGTGCRLHGLFTPRRPSLRYRPSDYSRDFAVHPTRGNVVSISHVSAVSSLEPKLFPGSTQRTFCSSQDSSWV